MNRGYLVRRITVIKTSYTNDLALTSQADDTGNDSARAVFGGEKFHAKFQIIGPTILPTSSNTVYNTRT